MPATAPGERPARSLPMARQVAKMGERPMLVSAMARVASGALGLKAMPIKPVSETITPSMTMRHAPMRIMRMLAPRRLLAASSHETLLRAAAMAGVWP